MWLSLPCRPSGPFGDIRWADDIEILLTNETPGSERVSRVRKAKHFCPSSGKCEGPR